MLTALSRPHSNIAIPLQYARDFTFSTSLDGDEEGRIVLSSILTKQAVSFQVGDDLSIYCTKLSKTVWRGQIERIEETKDGELIIEALGFGALQREARISAVLFDSYTSKWQVLDVNDLPGTGYSSRPDLWNFQNTNGLIEIKTKTTFTINNYRLFFIAYIFEQPERYYWIGTGNQTIWFSNFTFSGLASGVWVAPIINAPQHSSTALQCGSFTLFDGGGLPFVSTTGNCFGWVIGIAASGDETTAGATSVSFFAGINETTLDFAKLTNAFNARGGVCKITSSTTLSTSIAKPNVALPDLFATQPAKYLRKRFIRDTTKPTIHFYNTEPPFVWFLPLGQRIDDISQTPGRFFATYKGARIVHATPTRQNAAVESRRMLTTRFREEGEFPFKNAADVYLDRLEAVYKTKEAAFSVDLDNSKYELRTTTGAFVPNWAADVGDLASSLYSFAKLPIVSRTITKERTTYTVENAPSDALALFRRL
jgi:hypothetical protein